MVRHSFHSIHFISFIQSFDTHTADMRVLFEKVLSIMPKEKSVEVWNLFLKFEMLVGNLDAMTKVEKRRSQMYPEMDPSGILAVVQRYRFLDLWPCSTEDLHSFSIAATDTSSSSAATGGGKRVASQALKEEATTSGSNSMDTEDSAYSSSSSSSSSSIMSSRSSAAGPRRILPTKSNVTKPDLSQLVPYATTQQGGSGAAAGGGGGVPFGGGMGPGPNYHNNNNSNRTGSMLSSAVSHFIASLPPPQVWDGPLVDVERLLVSIRDAPYDRLLHPSQQQHLPPPPPPPPSSALQDAADLSDDEDHPTGGGGEGAGGLKRVATSTDIFKKRMIKKFKPNG
jgi:cleavage stimulation factor subunit 3